MRILKCIGVTSVLLVLNHHMHLDWWEAALLGFGVTAIIL